MIVAYEAEGGPGDLFVIDSIEDADAPAREDRILRDVWLQGEVQVVDGTDTLVYGPFGYEHDGAPLFAYQGDGDDEWVVAVLDGREVIEIDQVDSRPSMLVTGSGAYVIEEQSDSCAIHRLVGRSAKRVARADYCNVNGPADSAILVDRRPSEVVVSLIDLASERRTTVADSRDPFALGVSYAPNNRTVMIRSDTSVDTETIVIDIASAETIAEEPVSGQVSAVGGFFGYDISDGPDGSDSSPDFNVAVIFHPNSGSAQEVLAVGGSLIAVDHAGMTVALLKGDGTADPTLLMTTVDGGGVGALNEIAEFQGDFNIGFVGDGRLLVIEDDGVVGVADGRRLTEIGELRANGALDSPSISPTGANTWLVSMGESVGVVVGGSSPSFIEIEDLESYNYGIPSADGRWLAVIGRENVAGSDVSLVLVDLVNGESDVLDDEDGMKDIQFSGNEIYFTAEVDGENEARRSPLRLDGRTEDIAEGVRLFVPSDPTKTPRSWDRPFWAIEQ